MHFLLSKCRAMKWYRGAHLLVGRVLALAESLDDTKEAKLALCVDLLELWVGRMRHGRLAGVVANLLVSFRIVTHGAVRLRLGGEARSTMKRSGQKSDFGGPSRCRPERRCEGLRNEAR